MTGHFANTAADRLVEIAQQHFRFGQNAEHEAFAVPKSGANIALPLGTEAHDSFRAFLAREYRKALKTVPSNTQLSEAIQILNADCLEATPEPSFRRVAPCHDGGIAVDLGRSDGKTVLIHPKGPVRWHVADRSPVLFQRTQLMAAMPIPAEGGSLDEIPEVMGLSERHWSLLLGWVLAAYEPAIPHPILAIFGPAGAGKSFLAKLAVSLCDPSPCPLKSQPPSEGDWHLSATSSWVYAMDNLSEIGPWLAEALCKACTGDARAVRRLYTSKGLTVTSLKLPIILTAIEVGALRSDFGDRLVMLELPPRDGFTPEAKLADKIGHRLPFWLGALFHAISRTLEQKSITKPPTHSPRMADYAHVLACADRAGVTRNAFSEYVRNRRDTVQDAAEGDELVEAITGLLHRAPDGHWRGMATDLLSALQTGKRSVHSPGWPRAANQLSLRLKRLEPVLKECGVRYSARRETTSRRRLISLSLLRKEKASPASSGLPTDAAEPAKELQKLPDDDGAAFERSPNGEAIVYGNLSDDLRTMPGRSSAAPATPELYASRRCHSGDLLDSPTHGGDSSRCNREDCDSLIDFTSTHIIAPSPFGHTTEH